MTGQTTCPIPEVDRALSPYINTREDTIRIRRALSKYLTTSLRPVTSATQNQHLNHECPQGFSAANTNPPGLKDSRLGYLHALRAKSQAQVRYQELQESLEELQNRHIVEGPVQSDSEYDNEVTRSYVSLLRERRRFAELQVIQESVEKLLNARPPHAPKDPKSIIKDAIGEQPDLPAERLEQLSQPKDNQTGIFKLKQEVLDARASMDRANAARSEAQNRSRNNAPLQDQVYALEQAREEIVDWVQGELAKMEEESEFLEDASPIKRSTAPAASIDLALSETQVHTSYNKYTTSRSNLIEVHGSLQQQSDISSDTQPRPNHGSPSTQMANSSESTTFMSKILPHLPPLILAAKNERSLLQQAVYLQSQISYADEEMEESLLRLSGESHLLHGGSKDVTAWGKTAVESEAATKTFVKQKLHESGQEISSITTIVDLCSLQSKVISST